MTLSINGKTYEAGELIAYVQKLEKENLYYKDIVETNSAEWEEQGQRVVALEKENAELVQNKYNLEYKIESLENKIEHYQEVINTLQKENAELKKNCEDLKEFYEKEYFEIADRTADEKIKELEKYQEEVTVDDYSPYDENTWGMMHEEMYIPKELVREEFKESYALSEHRKDQLTKAKEIIREFVKYEINEYDGSLEIHFEELKKQAEQFLSEVEK